MLKPMLLVFITLTLSGTARAQRLFLQAPVIARFSVSTSVSVPDRGGMLLGGVSRGADGTKSFGPGSFPTGSSRGRSISHRSISSHVYIHDFAAMDPFLRRPPTPPVDTARERHARMARAAKAYARLADKFAKRGKAERAEWYRQKAREYAVKAGTSNAVSTARTSNGKLPR